MTTMIDDAGVQPVPTPTAVLRVYDVESRGLRGAPWAVAWCDLLSDGTIRDGGVAWCYPHTVCGAGGAPDPAADAWAAPAVAALMASGVPPVHSSDVLRALWRAWTEAKAAGIPLAGDCLWPVDGAALSAAHTLAMREEHASAFDGPFPLWDITSIVGATSGPIAEPDGKHDPRVDARWSAERLWASGWRPRT